MKNLPDKVTPKALQDWFAEEPQPKPTMPMRAVDQTDIAFFNDNIKTHGSPDGYKYDPKTGEPLPLNLEETIQNGNKAQALEDGFENLYDDSDSDLMGLNDAFDIALNRRPGFDY